nr:ribonuclease H-like domain-containing protein [Tanacetum cinerariifolium]
MLITLDVYLSYDKKVNGKSDWYGILDANTSDEDETIRKQYRKLALMLYHDKNKSVGAGDALKILSKAWTWLSDKVKRFTSHLHSANKANSNPTNGSTTNSTNTSQVDPIPVSNHAPTPTPSALEMPVSMDFTFSSSRATASYYNTNTGHPSISYHDYTRSSLEYEYWTVFSFGGQYIFSIKDYQTGRLLLHCDSTGDLYPVIQQSSSQTPVVLLSFNSTTWHRRLGHPGDDVLCRLESKKLISCRKSKLSALCHACQLEAMLDEYNALITNKTYKARFDANGRSQHHGIDCDKTFSPVVEPATIRTVLSLAVSRDWPIHHLDVKNAFLYGHLSETVYMHQPPRFVDPNKPNHVCHLQRSLYGLKQAPRAWFQRFASYVTRVGFQHSKTNSSLFVFHRGSDIAYLLLYVDDIILTASCSAFLQRIIASLHSEFAITDLAPLNYFLGISAQRSTSGLSFVSIKISKEILERAHMKNCNPCWTPVDTESKLGSDGDLVNDPTLYRSLASALQYLTFTRPDLSYDVQQLHVSSTTQLSVYTNADWVACPITRRSTSGYCVFLRDNLLSWSAKRQITLSRSNAEAEYRGVANVVAETAWIRYLLCELHTPLFTATLVYCDDVDAVYMSANLVQYQRTKHIEIDIHFVRDFVASGQVRVLHVPSRFQYADIFTKGLPTALFIAFRFSLNVRRSPAHTEGEC